MSYDNYGPFKVPRRGQIIDRARLSEFWRQVEHKDPGLSTAQGCYVFAIKAGKGYTPWYVGKATGRDGFLQEALADGKQNQCNWVWTSHGYRRGSMTARCSNDRFDADSSHKDFGFIGSGAGIRRVIADQPTVVVTKKAPSRMTPRRLLVKD